MNKSDANGHSTWGDSIKEAWNDFLSSFSGNVVNAGNNSSGSSDNSSSNSAAADSGSVNSSTSTNSAGVKTSGATAGQEQEKKKAPLRRAFNNACNGCINYYDRASRRFNKRPLDTALELLDAVPPNPATAAVGGGIKLGVGIFVIGKSTTKNINRFIKKLPANAKKNVKVYKLPNNGVAVQGTSLGNVPGSKAVYQKQINAAGKTMEYTKTTYDNAGKIVHVKDKLRGITIYGR